jgi:hypothetical protein
LSTDVSEVRTASIIRDESSTVIDNHFTRQYNPEDSSEHHVDNYFTRQYNPEDSSEHHVDNYFTRQYIPEDNSEIITVCSENSWKQ